jgi:hypothetical protein
MVRDTLLASSSTSFSSMAGRSRDAPAARTGEPERFLPVPRPMEPVELDLFICIPAPLPRLLRVPCWEDCLPGLLAMLAGELVGDCDRAIRSITRAAAMRAAELPSEVVCSSSAERLLVFTEAMVF